jgi:thiol-disulfide isomerase/thioredoxin
MLAAGALAGTVPPADGVEPGVTGLVVLVVVLVAATAFGLWRARTTGRLASPSARKRQPALSRDDLGQELGTRVTLVQFSSAFCAPCRATRQVLARVAENTEGVRHVEIDAESHLDLVRRFGITRTPTTLMLDRHGQIVQRSTGVPRLAQVGAAVEHLAAR